MEDESEFEREVDQHDRRRGEGMPTISALVGPIAVGQRLWCRWAERHSRVPVVVVGGTAEKWFRQSVRTLVDGRDLYLDAEAYLAQRLSKRVDVSRQSIGKKTLHELSLAFETADLEDHGVGSDRLCRWLLSRRALHGPLLADELARAQLEWAEPFARTPDAFCQLLNLLPSHALPALLVVPDIVSRSHPEEHETGSPIVAMQTIVQEMVNVATRVPRLTLATVVERSGWNAYIERAQASFAKAVIQEHVIQVRGWSADHVRQAVAEQTERSVDVPDQVFEEMARIGASTTLIESLCEASITDSAGTRPAASEAVANIEHGDVERQQDGQDPWKSAQERFLFQLLEHTTDLANRFELNGHPGFQFGNQEAEVDLLCPKLKIAVEIDGYYHFTSPVHYRRDRRKDIELQRHGFLVLRFLAEDVVPRMAWVLDSIRSAVRFRESQHSG